MMGMSVERYDTLEQSPKNEGNTLEQKESWDEKVDEKGKKEIGFVGDFLNLNRLKISPSDQF